MGTTRFSRLPNPIEIPAYVVSPIGGQVFYVDSGGIRDGYEDDIAAKMNATLGAALLQCRANRGDVIICMPQHAENVTTTPTFVAGVRIIGKGNGDERPTFSWTASTSNWALNVANVSIENCVLNLAATAATSVTKAITVTAASNTFLGNRIIMAAAGGAQLATIGIEIGTAADQFSFIGNDVFGPADGAVVDAIKVVAAVKKSRFLSNIMDLGMSATTKGVITFVTAAAVNTVIAGNILSNTITNSTKCLVGMTAVTGEVEYNSGYITNATGGATAFGTLGNWQLTENYGSAGAAVTGILIGTASS